MDLLCYVRPDWTPRIRPALTKRAWMDATPDSFAYRCLPLVMANAHGWEILSPCGFEARWDGGPTTDAVQIRLDPGTSDVFVPVSLFGAGILTFHIEGLFRTDPGWNLWVSGPPNAPKDAIAPLNGIVETDWSPYTFTMNWQFTRPGQWVRFEENEPICFFFPVERTSIEAVEPKLLPLGDNPPLEAQFEAWSNARMEFHARMQSDRPEQASESWQKSYYRGINPDGSPGPADHQSKLRVEPFRRADGTPLETATASPRPREGAGREAAPADRVAEWLLDTLEQQRASSASARTIHLRQGLGSQDFLDAYYAPGRPVLIAGAMAHWPALRLWRPSYLAEKLGAEAVELTDRERVAGEDGPEVREERPFADFISGDGSLVATSEGTTNRALLSGLWAELGYPEAYLAADDSRQDSRLTIALAGALTPLHLSLENRLDAQVMGHRGIVLLPPSETAKLYRRQGAFSEIDDIADPSLDLRRFPRAAAARKMEFVLKPGDMLYVPVGWWMQSRALDVAASAEFTRFKWPNDAGLAFPKA